MLIIQHVLVFAEPLTVPGLGEIELAQRSLLEPLKTLKNPVTDQ